MIRRCLSLMLLSSCSTLFAAGQDYSRDLPSRAQCKFSDGKTITIEYFGPEKNGRKIFGDVVPYGQVWETGTKKATIFISTSNLLIGGKTIPAGSYTIFTIPQPHDWTLILNKRTEKLNPPYSYEATELVRINLSLRRLIAPVNNFTITMDERFGGCVLNLRWEETEASVLIAEMK